MFPLTGLPLPQELLLITDELASPADFILHRSLATHLKSGQDARCIILSVSEDAARWNAIAGRSNLNLAPCLASQSVVLIEAESILTHPERHEFSSKSSLKALYDRIRDAVGETPSGLEPKTLVVVDDLAALEWIGMPVQELFRFVRALYAICRKAKAALIIRQHNVTPGEPDELLRSLLQLCTYHLDVLPLSSGRSGSVSGQVALHAGASVVDPPFKLVRRSAAVHYRLTDSGCVFFDRGTGGGVL
ncbi:uncharacterized protein LAESUDRAFT_692730 [Laetiporus sulphureus 93-53]|uniref:Elongator complex protein 6 n=1 Tax=Laetiporus sulphureus 93-53 TaxID=1314785 RepID=A0A165GNA3_9APHY|nr:uncharacterized protein LAESUDRAFT_692730 [Laetiporus sulphureus 93-53]KZT10582.1 hypothetical protein LAESUDRAFT_692730 [Laetiporus sulphureus 93-53]